jgi:hypothetical protein
MPRLSNLPLALLSLTSIAGCATVALSPEAARVAVVTSAPEACKPHGNVFGQGGGYWTVGEFVPNEKLVESAMADARNKAAKLGATHVLAGPVQITGESTTATVTATAFACP